MLTQTSSLVINTIKYGEQALICRCYTAQHGLKSFILKSPNEPKKSKNKVAFFMSLSQVELIVYQQRKNNLGLIKEVKNAYFYQSLHTEPQKIPIALFLSDLLKSVLKEEQPNVPLFKYLTKSLQRLDSKACHFADFHLWFMIELTRFLGFYPNTTELGLGCFHLKEGVFVAKSTSQGHCLNDAETDLFKRLLLLDFGPKRQNEFSRNQRAKLLQLLLRYYTLHLEHFRPPKSTEILAQLF